MENGLNAVEGMMKDCITEEYVDLDSYNEDSVTIHSDEIQDGDAEEEEEEEDSKY